MALTQDIPYRAAARSLQVILLTLLLLGAAPMPQDYFEIQVVDAKTGRGVPLVELVTVDEVRYVTDNAGRIAYFEPGHAGQTLFFRIEAPGYIVPMDGFGMAGVRLEIAPGERAEVRLVRENLAERLYRCTGQGLYRDSVLLGIESPLPEPLGMGGVAGQDSVQVVRYREKLYWFWGDTNRLSYPLGLFRMAGATTPLPGEGLPISQGMAYEYFTGEDGFARAMVEVADPKGVVWLDGFAVVPDGAGRECLVAHYSRRASLADELEHGIVVYNDDREIFEVRTTLPLNETWRFVHGHPARLPLSKLAPGIELIPPTFRGVAPRRPKNPEYLIFGLVFPVTRVRATLDALLDPARYESWSCMSPDADPERAIPLRKAAGALDWQWRKGPPVTPKIERRWLEDGLIAAHEARFLPLEAGNLERRVMMHAGTVRWNAYRQRWVMIANEVNMEPSSPSMLGEVWYSESDSPQGPFNWAIRVLTHDKQSFYNPRHHELFDEEGGRVVYFEGTYCNMFTNAPPTQRYNYNQVMYRLDLGHLGLRPVFGAVAAAANHGHDARAPIAAKVSGRSWPR
jgi:hypothetical protein